MSFRRRDLLLGGGALAYADALLQIFGASEVWPLVDIVTGTVIPAKVSTAQNGVLTGWDLQNTAGPVAGTLAPLSGAGDIGNIYSASLAALFNGTVGGAVIWVKSSDWTAANQYSFTLRADNNNLIRVYVDSPNRISWEYKAGATSKNRLKTSVTATGWVCLGLTWNLAAGADGEVRAYYNGIQEGATLTTLGTWAGALASDSCNLGGFITAAKNPWLGPIAFGAVRFGSTWTPDKMESIYLRANPT